jgi:hypothetical protein
MLAVVTMFAASMAAVLTTARTMTEEVLLTNAAATAPLRALRL